jgi:CHAT domain-containing protein
VFRLGQAGFVVGRARTGRAPEQLVGALDELVTALIEHGFDGPLVVELAGAVLDTAFVMAETQNDAASLTAAADRLTGVPSLAHLLQAYAHLAADADGALDPAIAELHHVLAASDPLAPLLRPDVTAMLAWLAVCRAPDDVETAVRRCESAQAMLDGRPSASDVVLARLLLWRALLPGARRDEQLSDLSRAIRLARRHCGHGRLGRWQAEIIRTNARHALESVSGTGDLGKQARRWYQAARAAARSSTADQARVALACVTWAVGTNEPDFAADAYDYLMSIVPLDAAIRYGSQARDLVLAQAQEHTEEAGFWLCRAGRYRDAVVALETGRAVTLGLAAAGEGAVQEPVVVTYDDITAATADGVVVYLGAAKAGGYALVVGGTFDPSYLELPRLDRATVENLRERCLPSFGHSRDMDVDSEGEPPRPDDLDQALRTLWDDGIRELVLQYAGARLLTMIPVGQLCLLPLHAAGDPGPVTDEMSAWRHAGNFSAIRYAPNARTLRRCRATVAELDDATLTMLAADVPEGYGAPPRLPHVTLETGLAAAVWQGRAQVERDCTWERFQKVAPGHGVWHLACHAIGSPFAAERSALVFEDAEVTLEEVRRALDRAPRRLVVLSACQTNTTGVALPNEVVGFPSTLLQLGFAGAIATAWSVDDQACAFLMTRFHWLWRRNGLHPAIALSRAQQWLRGATRAELAEMVPEIVVPGEEPYPFAHPLYWAAFAYTGA